MSNKKTIIATTTRKKRKKTPVKSTDKSPGKKLQDS